jgi:hypothetical protein
MLASMLHPHGRWLLRRSPSREIVARESLVGAKTALATASTICQRSVEAGAGDRITDESRHESASGSDRSCSSVASV